MGRSRTPTNLLEMRASFKAHPERKAQRAAEPTPQGDIGDPPASLKRKALRNIWYELIEITPKGVLTNADRIHLEIVCHLLYQFRSDPVDFPAMKHSRLEAMLGKIGLNPSDRSKVSIVKEKAENRFTRKKTESI